MKLSRLAFVFCPVLILAGCGPKRLKADFRGFESSFAETSNHEVLLNLARLENRDPTYFFKLGQITSTYKMQASLAGTGNYVIQGATGGGNAVGGGSTGIGYENDPVFTFIPVVDDTNALLLLKPVPSSTFYILFQQGWRVDQLFRLMVDRIELTTNDTRGNCVVRTIRNAPPGNYKAGGPDGELLSGYVTFLRLSGMFRYLQKQGYLLLRGAEHFVPVDQSVMGGVKVQVGATDLEKAANEGLIWHKEAGEGLWTLGKHTQEYAFYFNPPPPRTFVAGLPVGTESSDKALSLGVRSGMDSEKDWVTMGSDESRDRLLAYLQEGLSIEPGPAGRPQKVEKEGAPAGLNNPCPRPHLIMRSLLSVMSAAAQEHIGFDALKDANPEVPPTKFAPPDKKRQDMSFMAQIPAVERLPALRLTWDGVDLAADPLVKLDYRGRTYEVADAKDQGSGENQYWNRDMFRLLSQLQAQVTVDISKFPLPAVLQFNIP